MSDITAIILTFNEDKHLRRCLDSVTKVADRVCVIDSFSTDKTEVIAREMGVDFFQNPWPGHARQFNWALDNCAIETTWVMRVDADEYLEPLLIDSIKNFTLSPERHNGAVFKRKIVFMGRPIKHGFFYPGHILRLWKFGEGRIEQRLMDEHVQLLKPKTRVLDGDLTDENINDLSWWTQKHDKYALLEAYEISLSSSANAAASHISGAAGMKRLIKNNVYNKLPAGARGFFYFIFRYFIGLGFMDGREGFYFHFLQAFWYRVYVDAKHLELQKLAATSGKSVSQLLHDRGIAPRDEQASS